MGRDSGFVTEDFAIWRFRLTSDGALDASFDEDGGATVGSSIALMTIRDRAPSVTGATGGGAVGVLDALLLSLLLLAAALYRIRASQMIAAVDTVSTRRRRAGAFTARAT